MAWFQLADKLGQPLRVVKQLTSSTEFVTWMAYFDMKEEERTKQEFFLANIALEVRRSYVSNPGKYTLENFLISFEKKQAPELDEEDTIQSARQREEELKEKIAYSKAAWMALAGVSRKPPPQTKKK